MSADHDKLGVPFSALSKEFLGFSVNLVFTCQNTTEAINSTLFVRWLVNLNIRTHLSFIWLKFLTINLCDFSRQWPFLQLSASKYIEEESSVFFNLSNLTQGYSLNHHGKLETFGIVTNVKVSEEHITGYWILPTPPYYDNSAQ